MKRFLNLVALGLITLGSTAAFSQSRDLGARRIILDDGGAGRLTIEYAGPSSATLTFPDGGGSVTPAGTTINSTLRWSGSAWVENGNVLAGAAGTLSTTGVLSTTSASQVTGQSTFAGDIQPTSLRVKTSDGGWDGYAAFGGANATVVMGEFGTRASLGAHNTDLSAWSSLYINESGSNVRIGGSTAPTSTLDVTGSFATSGAATLGDGGDNINLNAGTGTFTLNSSTLDVNAGAITNATGYTGTGTVSSTLNTGGNAGFYIAVSGSATNTNSGTISNTGAIGINGYAQVTTGSDDFAIGGNFLASGGASVGADAIGGRFNASNGLVNLAVWAQTGDVRINALTASRPVLSDGDKDLVSGAIDLANANHVTGTLAVANGGTGAATVADNLVFAGPVSGGPLAPSFRALVGADIPAGSGSYIQNGVGVQAGANFNIDGSGTAGTLSAGTTVNATTRYNVNGVHALSLFGTGNTRVGSGASQNITTGTYNTSLGYQAGRLLTSGIENTFLGTQAGDNVTTGIQNTIIGKDAGYGSTGSGNSILGVYAGYATTGSENTFVGKSAGFANTTGANNTYVGTSAGGSAALSNASAFGNGATATASNQVVLGNESVTQVTTAGSINTATGFTIGSENALRWNTVSSTLSVGNSASSGTNNVFVGEGAGAVASGNNNVMLGNGAGVLSSAISDQNVIIGPTAGYQLNGDNNVALGGGEVGRNHNGNNSVFIGYAAGSHIAFGGPVADANTMIGAETGRQTSTGGSNTFLGYNSGTTNTTGNQNTYLGASTDGAAGLVNATAIGYDATATANNQVVLGNASVTEVLTTGNLNAPSATLNTKNLATGTLRLTPTFMALTDYTNIVFADGDVGTGPVEIRYTDDTAPSIHVMGGALSLQSLRVASGADRYAGIITTDDASIDMIESFSNTLITASSIVTVTLNSSLGGTYIVNAIPGAGTLTVTFSATVVDGSKLSYIIVNP